MIFDDLLEQLGIGVFFAALIFPLWKADDAISPTFRDDIRDVIIGVRFVRTNEIAQFVNSVFSLFFGARLLSLRSFLLCSVITTIIGIVTIGSRTTYQIFFQDASTFLRAFAILILPLCVTAVFSLLWTRLLIRWAAGRGNLATSVFALALDLILLVLIGAIPTIIISQSFDFLTIQVAVLYSLTAPLFAMGQDFLFDGQDAAVAMLPVLSAWYTSAIYSLFIWISVLGILVANQALRLNSIHAAVTYALPFDTKPLRSLGLIIIFCALLVLAIVNVITLGVGGLNLSS